MVGRGNTPEDHRAKGRWLRDRYAHGGRAWLIVEVLAGLVIVAFMVGGLLYINLR